MCQTVAPTKALGQVGKYSNMWGYREGYVSLGRQRSSLLLTLWAHELIDPLHLTICRSQIETLKMKWQQKRDWFLKGIPGQKTVEFKLGNL